MNPAQHLQFEVSRDDGKTWVYMPMAPNNALAVPPDRFFPLRYRVSTDVAGTITVAIPTKTRNNPEGLFDFSDWKRISVTPEEEVSKASNRSILTIADVVAGKHYPFQLQQEDEVDLIEQLPCPVTVSLYAQGDKTEEVMYLLALRKTGAPPTISLFDPDKLVYLRNETVYLRFKVGHTKQAADSGQYEVQLLAGSQKVPYALQENESGILEGEFTASLPQRYNCSLEVRSLAAGLVAREEVMIEVIEGKPREGYLYPFLLKDPSIQLPENRKAPANNDNRNRQWQVMGIFTRPDEPNHLYALLLKGKAGRLYVSPDGSEWKQFMRDGQPLDLEDGWLDSPYCTSQNGYLYLVGGSRYAPNLSSKLVQVPLSISLQGDIREKELTLDGEPFEISGHALLTVDANLYLVGGFNDSGTSDAIYRIDPNTGELTLVARMKAGDKRYRICNHQLRLVGDMVYLFGGSASGFDAGYKKMQEALYMFPITDLGKQEISLIKANHAGASTHGITGSGVFSDQSGTVFLAGSRGKIDAQGQFTNAFSAVKLLENGFKTIDLSLSVPGAESFQLHGAYFKGAVWMAYSSDTTIGKEPLQYKIINVYVG